MTDEQLNEIEKLARDAVGGEWERLAHDCSENDCSVYIQIAGYGHFILGAPEERFILKSRKNVILLIANLRTEREKSKRYEEALKFYGDMDFDEYGGHSAPHIEITRSNGRGTCIDNGRRAREALASGGGE